MINCFLVPRVCQIVKLFVKWSICSSICSSIWGNPGRCRRGILSPKLQDEGVDDAWQVLGPVGIGVESALLILAQKKSVGVEGGGTGTDDGSEPARVTALHQNYPNPFNPATSVAFSLSSRERVTVAVYDVSGRRVAVLVDEDVEPGVSSVRWDGRDDAGMEVSSGTYFVRMTVGSELFEKKMTLLR